MIHSLYACASLLVASCAAIFYMNLRIGNAEFVRYAAFLVIPFVSIIYSTMAYSINIENAGCMVIQSGLLSLSP